MTSSLHLHCRSTRMIIEEIKSVLWMHQACYQTLNMIHLMSLLILRSSHAAWSLWILHFMINSEEKMIITTYHISEVRVFNTREKFQQLHIRTSCDRQFHICELRLWLNTQAKTVNHELILSKKSIFQLIKSIWSRVINCIIQVINWRNNDVEMKSISHEVRRIKQSWLNDAHSD